jgi:hypothetical protein
MHAPECDALPVTQSLRLQAREQFIAAEIREFPPYCNRERDEYFVFL